MNLSLLYSQKIDHFEHSLSQITIIKANGIPRAVVPIVNRNGAFNQPDNSDSTGNVSQGPSYMSTLQAPTVFIKTLLSSALEISADFRLT